MSSPAAFAESESPGKTIGGHPAGLYVLFGAEMWERFSYYGMRALLVLYLVNHLAWDREDALNLYAIYTGLVYITPILGGILADRYLGQRKAVLIGGLLMAAGHFAMAFEPLLYPALGLLILGNGFFKPNISTMVGQLYGPNDARRDGAYTIFYMGINLGALAAPLACGYLGESEYWGWHYGFGLAGIGMVLGLACFAAFQRSLGGAGLAPGRAALGDRILSAVDYIQVLVLFAVGAGLVWLALMPTGTDAIAAIAQRLPEAAIRPAFLGYWVALAVGFWFITKLVTRSGGGSGEQPQVGPESSPIQAASTGDVADAVEPGRGLAGAPGAQLDEEFEEAPKAPLTAGQWNRIVVALIVSAFSVVFWMGFEQAGGTLNLFADQETDRAAFDREIPASWFQSINALWVVSLAPLFSMFWTMLDRTKFRVNSAAKMGLGLIFLGLGMIVMYVADGRASPENKVSPVWLVAVYFLHTVGELCLSPIGLSLINKLAPLRVASLMMALWFTCTGIANYLAGRLESYVGEDILWTVLIFTSIVPGLILLALNPILKKMGQGRI